MIFTASTIKDTLPNVQTFVERNLASGADHLFVFLDAPEPDVEAWLAQHPHVTHVVCDESWWLPHRPEKLNARQVTNANLVSSLLACFDWAEWLFHLDADECLEVDRDRLGEVPADRTAVRLRPLEAISNLHGEDRQHYKRLLTRDEAHALAEKGLIEAPRDDEPASATYFRGHVLGKAGVRPGLDWWMQLHRTVYVGPEETEVPTFLAGWLGHRHYESVSGREFIRKWLSHLAAGEIRLRERRRLLFNDIRKVAEDPSLDEAGREAALTRIYTERVEDRYDDLLAAGVLVELPEPSYTPREFPPGGREQLERLFEVLRTADKRYANPRVTDLLPRQLFEQLAEEHPDLAPLLQRAIDAARVSEQARGALPPAAVVPADSPARGRWKSALQRVVPSRRT